MILFPDDERRAGVHPPDMTSRDRFRVRRVFVESSRDDADIDSHSPGHTHSSRSISICIGDKGGKPTTATTRSHHSKEGAAHSKTRSKKGSNLLLCASKKSQRILRNTRKGRTVAAVTRKKEDE
jgi:hypothetical protein